MTYDGSLIRLYIDGAESSTFPVIAFGVSWTQTGNPNYAGSTDGAFIGASSGEPSRLFHGLIDEVELYDRPLSATETRVIFAADSLGKCKVAVEIDIKPGDFPNSISRRSRGRIPVAILSSTTFNAPADVDPTSLTFGRSGDEKSLTSCKRSGEDLNGDGLVDLICYFDSPTAAFQSGDTEGILKGRTSQGTTFLGSDAVKIVP